MKSMPEFEATDFCGEFVAMISKTGKVWYDPHFAEKVEEMFSVKLPGGENNENVCNE